MIAGGPRLVIGAGAQGRVVVEAWRAQDPSGELAFLDDQPALWGTRVLGASVLGAVSLATERGSAIVLGIGRNPLRLELAARLTALGAAWGTVVHPSAVVAPSAEIGPGTVVLPAAVIHTSARVGAHVVVNTGVLVEHDCILEDGASLSPGARMGGRVHVERGAFISVGVTLAPRVRVGAGSIVGAGAVVVRDVPPGMLAYGVPARVVRPISGDADWGRLL